MISRSLPIMLSVVFLTMFSQIVEGTSIAQLPGGSSISNMVKHSDIVLTGEIIDLSPVYRADLPPHYTTDVTVKIKKLIKGEPNTPTQHVRFTLLAGVGTNPRTGTRIRAHTPGMPTYREGQEVLLFLVKALPPRFGESPRPYDGLIPLRFQAGSREIRKEVVAVPYTVEQEVEIEAGQIELKPIERFIELPVDMVVQIAQASLSDDEQRIVVVRSVEVQIVEFIKRTPLTSISIRPDKAWLMQIRLQMQQLLGNGAEQ